MPCGGSEAGEAQQRSKAREHRRESRRWCTGGQLPGGTPAKAAGALLVDGRDAAARTGRRGSDGQGRRRGAEGRRGARRRGHLKLLLVVLGGGRIGGGAASDGGLMGGGKGSGTGILLWCVARRARGGKDGRWGSGCGSRRRASRPTEERERARLQAALGGSGAARRWREYEGNQAQGWRRKRIERRGAGDRVRER